MKKLLAVLCFLVVSWTSSACWKSSYPDRPGTLFIRQQICDISDFKARFFIPRNDLKGRGFLAYRFYRDVNDPKTYLLAFECADLKKAVDFIQSSNFIVACVGAGLGTPVMWAGEELTPLLSRDEKALGWMVARYESTDDVERVEKLDSSASWYGFSGGGTVLEAKAVADIHQLREVMESPYEKNRRKTAGVINEQFWWGTYLEKGSLK